MVETGAARIHCVNLTMLPGYYERETLLGVSVIGESPLKLSIEFLKLEHDVHLLVIGFKLECKCLIVCGHITLEFCSDMNANSVLVQPLKLVTHLNDKEWIQIDSQRG